MKKIFHKKNTGFTLIETMIAVAIFSIVVTIGVGSLLNAYNIHRKTRDMRSIMDNLNFIMEDISKTARTGYSYKCEGNFDCGLGNAALGKNITLTDQYGKDVSYLIDGKGFITKVDSSGNEVALNDPTQIKIDTSGRSGFILVGADPTDTLQPFLTIILAGEISSKGNRTPFYLRTSVSERMLDRK